MKVTKLIAALALAATASAAFAHGGHGGSRGGVYPAPDTKVSATATAQTGAPTKTLAKADVPVASDAAQNALYSH